jgi:hypothetical protein
MNLRSDWSQPRVARVQLVRELGDPTPARDPQQQQPQPGTMPDQPQALPTQREPEARPKIGRPPKVRNPGLAAAGPTTAAAAAPPSQPRPRGRPKGAQGAKQLAPAPAPALRDPNTTRDHPQQPQPGMVPDQLHQSLESGGAAPGSGTMPDQMQPRQRGEQKEPRNWSQLQPPISGTQHGTLQHHLHLQESLKYHSQGQDQPEGGPRRPPRQPDPARAPQTIQEAASSRRPSQQPARGGREPG